MKPDNRLQYIEYHRPHSQIRTLPEEVNPFLIKGVYQKNRGRMDNGSANSGVGQEVEEEEEENKKKMVWQRISNCLTKSAAAAAAEHVKLTASAKTSRSLSGFSRQLPSTAAA
ncbi:hypothetical protein STEG23_016268 [Scotinomys teguina]